MSRLQSPAHTTYNIQTRKAGSDIAVQISAPDIKAENLPLSTWIASVVLAKQLHKFHFTLPTQDAQSDNDVFPVIELGAGTGLVGLSACCIWKTRAVLTDLAPIVPGLHANIVLNRDKVSQNGGRAACGALDWAKPESLHLEEDDGHVKKIPSSRKARVLLAADTIYDSDHPGLLTSAIFEWLERSALARVCICYPLRIAYLDEIRELWQRLEDGGLESILDGQETYIGENTNGDDEALCEWSVWRWKELATANVAVA